VPLVVQTPFQALGSSGPVGTWRTRPVTAFATWTDATPTVPGGITFNLAALNHGDVKADEVVWNLYQTPPNGFVAQYDEATVYALALRDLVAKKRAWITSQNAEIAKFHLRNHIFAYCGLQSPAKHRLTAQEAVRRRVDRPVKLNKDDSSMLVNHPRVPVAVRQVYMGLYGSR
jgi:hypothetical protein